MTLSTAPTSRPGLIVHLVSCGLLLVHGLLAGCARLPVGEMRTVQYQVEGGQVTGARTLLRLGVGDLELARGGDLLFDAEVSTNVEGWMPDHVALPRDGVQEVTMAQPRGSAGSGARNEWKVRLGSDLPQDLEVTCGVAEVSLDLRGIELTLLRAAMGVGDLSIDLSGPRKGSLEGQITGGTGLTRVVLPRELGARVDVTRGIGSIDAQGLRKTEEGYVNEAWGTTEVSIDLEIKLGVGEVRLELR